MKPHISKVVREEQVKQVSEKSFFRYLVKNHPLYIMLLPGIIYLLIFKYLPMIGSVIAFQNYNLFKGFMASPWVGFEWFEQLFMYPRFTRLLWNTLTISAYQLIFSFPVPIILACLLNELRLLAYKRVVQTIVYLPHFLSWTLIYGLSFALLAGESGMINLYLSEWGFEKIKFLQEPEYFRTLIVTSGIWKDMGWSSIIFLAALAGINPTMYEAAKIDGAGRWLQFRYITLRGLVPAIAVLMLLKIGHILDVGFEHIQVFLTPLTYEVGDVLDTYSYRAGVVGGQYSFTTAIGLFKSFVGLLLTIIANRVSRVTSGESLY